MKKLSLITALTSLSLLLNLGSCATNSEQPVKELSTNDNSISENFGSALDQDKDARLDFLTKTITEKRGLLMNAKKANNNLKTEDTELQVEILDNEILLLEAEMYGLQEGMELNPSEL